MRHGLFAVALALGVLVPATHGGPPDGPYWTAELAPKSDEAAPGTKSFDQRFVAGKRACVIVIGDHKPVVDVEVKVFDAKGNLVVQDRGTAPVPDFVAVMWYPPRTETYRVEIANYGKQDVNICSVAVK